MPSRKKQRGKARRVKAASRCTHGCPLHQMPIPLKDSMPNSRESSTTMMLVLDFKEALQSVIDLSFSDANDANTRIMGIFSEKNLYEAWFEETRRDTLLSSLVSIGTDFLLKDCTFAEENEQRYTRYTAMAGATASIILSLEHNDAVISHVERKRRDFFFGGQREVTKFFSQRTECACLDAKYKLLKGYTKLGGCDGCWMIAKRTDLLLCSGCRVCQYCSVRCQTDNWPRHRDYCKNVFWL